MKLIDKRYGKAYLVCDICDEEHCFEDFDEAIQGKKDLGYISKKHLGVWTDLCLECQYEY